MCNLNETSSKTLVQFQNHFEGEVQNLNSIRENLLKNKNKYPNRILIMTKLIKGILKSRTEKK